MITYNGVDSGQQTAHSEPAAKTALCNTAHYVCNLENIWKIEKKTLIYGLYQNIHLYVPLPWPKT